MKGKDVKFAGIELVPAKHFVKTVSRKQHGFRKLETKVGNAQMQDDAFMAEALRRALASGFTTIQFFMATSGLKYHSAQRYLNQLCSGEHPTLRKRKVGSTIHYFPLPK